MTKFFDAHTHFQDDRLKGDRTVIIEKLQKGWGKIVICATHEGDWDDVYNLSQLTSSLIPSVGIHPWWAKTASYNWYENLQRFLDSHTVAVGECGLDLRSVCSHHAEQIDIFHKHIECAVERKLPLSIHCIKAWKEFFEITKKFSFNDVPALIHSYSGSADMVDGLVKKGFYLSFSAGILNKSNKKMRAAVKVTPLENLLIETDAPDQLPYDLKGSYKYSTPFILPLVAQEVALIKGVEPHEVISHTFANGNRCFSCVVV